MSKSLQNRQKEFWINFENKVSEVICLGLSYLLEKHDLQEKEDEINRTLYFCFQKANYLLQKQEPKRGDYIPIYESRSQPFYNDEERANREDKRPDFQWVKTDLSTTNPYNSAKQYVVECKRLGNPSSDTWILNKNYIVNGIKRFISEKWGYGKGTPTSAMIGYIQSMVLQDVLNEVNQNAIKNNIPELIPKSSLNEKGVSKLHHSINCVYEEKELKLKHFWIDLRDKYN